MLEWFGKIIVCGDYEGDLNAIVDKLNSLYWSPSERKFSVYKGEREFIVLNGFVRNPCLRKAVVLKDGHRCFLDEADVKQWRRRDGTFEWGKCTLNELSGLIAPYLNKGTIEFVAVQGVSNYVSHERLLVRLDGSAEWHTCSSINGVHGVTAPGHGPGTLISSEYYEPIRDDHGTQGF